MIQSDYDKDIQEFIEEHTKVVKKMITANGGMSPMLAIFCLNKNVKEGEKPFQVNVFNIPPQLVNDAGKDMLSKFIIPKIIEGMKTTNHEPLCVSFASEAWTRKVTKEEWDEVKDNWRDLPKEECLLITYETEWKTLTKGFNITREGTHVDEYGDAVDNIVLTPREDITSDRMEGRFANLFQKYREYTN
jgi:hypothetical protein